MTSGPLRVLHIYNTANVPYLLAYGAQKFFGTKSFLLLPFPARDNLARTFIYGYDSGNPLGVSILYYRLGKPRERFDFIRVLTRQRFDIIILHDGGGIFSSVLAKMSQARIIRYFHGGELRRNYRNTGWSSGRTGRVCYGALGESWNLVATPDLLPYVNWKGSIGRTSYMPIPVDPMFTASELEERDSYTVFLPTRHDELTKRTSVAFDAWKILRGLDPRIKLKTILWGVDSSRFYEQFRGDKRTEWLPPLSRADFVSHMRRCGVVWGQFALGILATSELEAMTIGRPVVAYWKRRLYSPPFYDKYPPIISSTSPRVIAESTWNLMKNVDSRTGLIERARIWTSEYHSLEAVSKKLFQVCDKLR